MTTNPWSSAVLPRKTAEMISLAINAACTNLNPDGTRRHIRAALAAGATRDEILMLLKMASVMSIHSCSLGAPILARRSESGRHQSLQRGRRRVTPGMRQDAAQWASGMQAWDPFFELDPVWTEQFMAAGHRHLRQRR